MGLVARAITVARRDGLAALLRKGSRYIYRRWARFNVASVAFQLALVFLSALVPRRDDLWVFGSHFGYSDNSKYMYLHAHENTSVDAVWVAPSKETVQSLTDSGYPATYAYSIGGILTLLRARVVMTTRALSDIGNWGAILRARPVLLGHGTPMMESTNEKTTWEALKERRVLKNFDAYVITSAQQPKKAFEMTEYYPIESPEFLVAGYPRTDVWFKQIDGADADAAGLLTQVPQHVSDEADLIFYLPTKRHYDRPNPLFMEDAIEQLNDVLGSLDAHLVVKLHPRATDDPEIGVDHITVLPNEIDVYPALKHADLLVTDYSSIYLDFLLLDRPIVFFPHDMEAFCDSRPMIFDYEDITPGPTVSSVEGLVTELKRELDNPERYSEQRSAIRRQYFDSTGVCAAKELFEQVRES